MKSESTETGPLQTAGQDGESETFEGTAELTYISALLGELNQMADRAGYSMLSYFLDLARLEATELKKKELEKKEREQNEQKHKKIAPDAQTEFKTEHKTDDPE